MSCLIFTSQKKVRKIMLSYDIRIANCVSTIGKQFFATDWTTSESEGKKWKKTRSPSLTKKN